MYTLHACDKNGKVVQQCGLTVCMNSALETGSNLLKTHRYDAVCVQKNGADVAVLNLAAMMLDPPEYGRTGL